MFLNHEQARPLQILLRQDCLVFLSLFFIVLFLKFLSAVVFLFNEIPDINIAFSRTLRNNRIFSKK